MKCFTSHQYTNYLTYSIIPYIVKLAVKKLGNAILKIMKICQIIRSTSLNR